MVRVVRIGCALFGTFALVSPGTAGADGLLVCDEELRPVARALEEAGLAVVPPDPRHPPPRARERIAEAARLYAAMRLDDALARIAEARADLDRTGAEDAGPDDVVRVEILGALARAVGRPRPDLEVDAALERALAVDPDLVVDPVEYPPWLRSRLEELRAVRPPLATIEIRGDPGALAWIDGESTCRLPCSLEIPRGRHRVRVTLAGRLPFVEVSQIDSGTASVEATLPPDAAALAVAARAAIDSGRPPEEALAHFDPVVALRRSSGPNGRSELSATLFGRDGQRRTARAPVGGPIAIEAAARRVAEALLAPPPAPRRATRHRGPPPAEPRWYEHAWLWAGAGAILVAGGVAAALAASGSGDGQFVGVVRTP